MPPRLNKRQQRALEELQTLGGPSNASLSSDDDAPLPKKPAFSNFLAAEEIGSGSEEDEDEGLVQPAKSRKKKKSKKKSEAPTPTPKSTPAIPTPSIVKNEKKAVKKAKAKEKKAADDELDQALAELSLKFPDLQKPSPPTSTSPHTLSALLAVSLPHLDSEAELRKFFGSKVIQANKSSSSPGGGAARRNAAAQRSHLTRPQAGWWSASQREGLSIRVLSGEEVEGKGGGGGEKWWTVEYSQRYKSMTKMFIQAVMSGHPDALWEIQRKLPWHADNLLQLAEVYRHREEYAQAVDFIDRALFTYERAFIGAFTFTSGTNRLDFNRVENRPFFLAVHRQIGDLQRRGCVRTAFEFSRLMYGLDPWGDPHGALFHLDLLAIKAGMGAWLIEVFDHFAGVRVQREREGVGKGKEGEGGRMDPSVLPGWMYARALALKMREDAAGESTHEASTAALTQALRSFPSVLPLLADKLDIALPPSIRAHRDFKIETQPGPLSPPVAAMHALSHMYAQRSAGVWKDPKHGYASWLLSTATSAFSSLGSAAVPVTAERKTFLGLFQGLELQYALYRHITVVEGAGAGGRLGVWIPRWAQAEAKGLACDPLPPGSAVTRYDEAYFRGTEDVFTLRGRGRGRGAEGRREDERMLEGIIPDAGVRRRVLVGSSFPLYFGGSLIKGLAEMMERLGPEAMEDVLGQIQAAVIAQDVLGGAQGQGMPGEMPGFGAEPEPEPEPVVLDPVVAVPGDLAQVGGAGVAGEAGGESDSESEEEDPSAMQRVLRNILGRFWGGGGAVGGGEETSEDEDEEVDRNGVD
ncbi:transcriptional repressor TCF25-domain-containing protein [Lyophyllum atratum]|nr:transcriptional repressor TCF25-domain-containing protein [Lyophyllum atratum]